MKTRIMAHYTLCAFVLIITCGALRGSDVTVSTSLMTATTNGFAFSIETTNNAVAVGQEIIVSAVLENTSANAQPVVVRDGLMEYSFQVVCPDNELAATTVYGDRLLAPVALFHQSGENIAPNHFWRDAIPLNKMFIMTNTGEYRITVTRETANGQKMTAGPLSILLTNSVGNK